MTQGSVSIRPEDVHLGEPGAGAITGTVTFVRDLGGTIETFVECGGTTDRRGRRRRASGPTCTPATRSASCCRPKLRGAEAMRREAAKTIADYTPLLLPGASC